MQQPERVFAEVFRVLKPGGVFILTFSNRMFYDKVGAMRSLACMYAADSCAPAPPSRYMHILRLCA
jgi:ubiquinone/menaquinone biosynthesis C-methylase UbiE